MQKIWKYPSFDQDLTKPDRVFQQVSLYYDIGFRVARTF